MSVLHISCAAEGAPYVAHSAAMLGSVLAHRGAADIHVHYLHSPRLPARSGELLGEMVEAGGGSLSLWSIDDERVAGLPSAMRFTAAMWYRLFLPELLPGLDRVLYLDVDTLAVDDLSPLAAVDLGDHYLAAVTNVFEPHFRHRPAELGIADRHAYFNSGVLLLNLDALRRDGCTAALVDFARAEGDRLEWPDQDTLNVVLGARRLPLAPRWNAMNSVIEFAESTEVFGAEAVREARERPAIRHFEGPEANKPWHYLAEDDAREQYLAYRRATPWPDFVPDAWTRANRLRRMARTVRRRLRP